MVVSGGVLVLQRVLLRLEQHAVGTLGHELLELEGGLAGLVRLQERGLFAGDVLDFVAPLRAHNLLVVDLALLVDIGQCQTRQIRRAEAVQVAVLFGRGLGPVTLHQCCGLGRVEKAVEVRPRQDVFDARKELFHGLQRSKQRNHATEAVKRDRVVERVAQHGVETLQVDLLDAREVEFEALDEHLFKVLVQHLGVLGLEGLLGENAALVHTRGNDEHVTRTLVILPRHSRLMTFLPTLSGHNMSVTTCSYFFRICGK